MPFRRQLSGGYGCEDESWQGVPAVRQIRVAAKKVAPRCVGSRLQSMGQERGAVFHRWPAYHHVGYELEFWRKRRKFQLTVFVSPINVRFL